MILKVTRGHREWRYPISHVANHFLLVDYNNNVFLFCIVSEIGLLQLFSVHEKSLSFVMAVKTICHLHPRLTCKQVLVNICCTF